MEIIKFVIFQLKMTETEKVNENGSEEQGCILKCFKQYP